MSAVESVRWSADGGAVDIIDQRLLPGTLVRRELRTVEEVCDAIATLAVRGAPAIGVAGAMGLVVSLLPLERAPALAFAARLAQHADRRGEPAVGGRPDARSRRPRPRRRPGGDARRAARRGDADPRGGPRDVP